MEASHVTALQSKHAGLEKRIADELHRPNPDTVILQSLKKRKLRLKEQMLAH